MRKVVISVFPDEASAFEGLSALKSLHRQGDITLYASSVVAKDELGAVSIRQQADQGPVGTLVGMVTGGLLGLIGGPAGVAIGASFGSLTGLMVDLFAAGVSEDFVGEASAALEPGSAAVVADMDESWVTPVDTRLAALGGRTFRRVASEMVDEELVRESRAASAEMEQLGAELRESVAEQKANVRSAIEKQRQKLASLVARVDTTLAERKAEHEARLKTLKAQQEQAQDQQRARIDARVAELKADHEARQAKLAEARRLAQESADMFKEAVAP